MDPITIRYCFLLSDEVDELFELVVDPETLELQGNIPETLPEWASLDFCKCPHCPLDVQTHSHCLVAANLVSVLDRFDSLFSYNQTHLVVTTKDRMISQVTKIQQAVSSLLGLVIATSGCPHTHFFKPMARFHLPLASNAETTFRAVSMYLLAQYFLNKEGKPVDFELKGLREIYRNIQLLNRCIADRLRAAAKTDSVLNAIVQLDIYAQTLLSVIENSLEELRGLFDAYLKK